MHHVLIRDEDDPTLYRRITEADRERLKVCFDGDLYRIVNDSEMLICLGSEEERLCNFDQPHDHPVLPIMGGDPDLRRMDNARRVVVAE
jgi:hypothetical protein